MIKSPLLNCHQEVIPNKKSNEYSQHSLISQSASSNGKNEWKGPKIYFHDSLYGSSMPSNSILDEKEQYDSISCVHSVM